jgi:serine/threonine protein kinase
LTNSGTQQSDVSSALLIFLVSADYIEDKRDFPWGLRLSIASGIAKGLAFIYQRSEDLEEIIPHGNLKLSNILLDENNVPLISEYGFSRFLDSTKLCVLNHISGYTAPEKSLTEKGDVFSFGVILLELLTGKTVEKSGIDLPKWVRAMVREEWTGEVFDKEVSKAAIHWAFPLLNIALKCVLHSPEDRPTMAEVLEKIEEVVTVQGDHSKSPDESVCGSNQHDCCVLHTIITDTWDSPGSNY